MEEDKWKNLDEKPGRHPAILSLACRKRYPSLNIVSRKYMPKDQHSLKAYVFQSLYLLPVVHNQEYIQTWIF